MAPLRHQTGALCRPAFPPGADAEGRAERDEEAAKRLEDERYWRREAERLRKRVAPLQDRAEELRLKIAQRRREPDVPLVGDPQIEAWEAEAERLARRSRELELRLLERARRAGALPGWLR
jgi:hypothetical protein